MFRNTDQSVINPLSVTCIYSNENGLIMKYALGNSSFKGYTGLGFKPHLTWYDTYLVDNKSLADGLL